MKVTDIGWHFGRKDIVKALTHLGICTSWRTVRRMRKAGTLLVRQTPEGKPFIIESEIISQRIKQSEVVKK